MVIPSFDRQQLLPLATFMGMAAVVVLTLLSLSLSQPAIETDLLQRTRQALVEAGLPSDSIRFSGRDGILNGTVASEAQAQQLQAVVSGVYGVRAVENNLIPAETAAAPVSDAAQTVPATPTALHTPSRQYPIEQIGLGAIQFEYSRAELDAAAIKALEQVLTELRQHPAMKIEVSAHTDSQGTALGNLAVTQARAEVVRNYLLSQDIEAGRVKAVGYGSTRPLTDNADEAGRKQNRRIEITVLGE